MQVEEDSRSPQGVERLRDEFRALCRRHGLRLTPQRIAIYSVVKGAENHPSAEMIYGKVRADFPGISFDTVNRTLVRFAEMGIINIVEGFGESRRFDPKTAAHHHLVCARCKTIVDIVDPGYDNLPLSKQIEKDFTVLSKRVVVLGICKRCGQAGK